MVPSPETAEEKANLARSLELYREYFERNISEAMFAGFILEAAYIANACFLATRRSLRLAPTLLQTAIQRFSSASARSGMASPRGFNVAVSRC